MSKKDVFSNRRGFLKSSVAVGISAGAATSAYSAAPKNLDNGFLEIDPWSKIGRAHV